MSDLKKKNSDISYASYHHSSQNAKTILITNNYTQNGVVGGTSSTGVGGVGSGATNSITILTTNPNSGTVDTVDASSVGTVVLDRINICINNHYDSARTTSTQVMPVVNIKTEKPDPDTGAYGGMSAPGSKYVEGEDVLVKQKDGRFYLGTIIVVAPNQCLVKFDDNTQKWASHGELKQFGTSKVEDTGPFCVVCKIKQEIEAVEVCERCGRGYHRRCTEGNFGANGVWYCRRCSAQNGIKEFQNQNKLAGNETADKLTLTSKNQLPYDLNSLKWDTKHRENKQQQYCYCGGTGEWLKQMLQCSRCQQWFHEKCIGCIKFPLFSGDRFYIFVCSVCNSGTEFLRRLEMSWNDVVHLLLFNLTVHNSPTKYFDLATQILPYFLDLKEVLQLPNYMNNLVSPVVKHKISNVLKGNTARFRPCKEKKTWSLQELEPPQAPFVIFPDESEPISVHYIRKLWPIQKHPLGFVTPSNNSTDILKDFNNWRRRIHGKNLMSKNASKTKIDDDDKSPVDSDDEIPIKYIIEKDKIGKLCERKSIETSTGHSSSTSVASSMKIESHENSRDAFDDTSHDSFLSTSKPISNDKKRRLRKRSAPLEHSATDEIFERKTKLSLPPPDESMNDDDTSSRSTLDLIIPPPKDFQGTNNPFNPTYAPIPKSVASNVTPNSRQEDRSSLQEANGKNQSKKRLKKGSNTFLNGIAPSNVRIVRTIRRRLSAKDIVIGPNQEVKYKRNSKRKRQGDVEVISTTTISTASNMATLLPIRTEFKDWNASSKSPHLFASNTIGSNSLPNSLPPLIPLSAISQKRASQDGASTSSNASSSLVGGVQNTSIKDSSPSCTSIMGGDTQLAGVSPYFESTNQLRNSDNYVIRGRRIDASGHKQYLIEWTGNSRASLF